MKKKRKGKSEGKVSQAELITLQVKGWLCDHNFTAPHLPRARDPGDYPVHVAVVEQNMVVLQWLIQQPGVSVRVLNDYGDGPLQNAAFSPVPHEFITVVLRAADAEAREENANGGLY